jgi:protein TonB
MVTFRSELAAVSSPAGARLLLACVVSFLAHVALIVGVQVNPTGGAPHIVSTITARLEPAVAIEEVTPKVESGSPTALEPLPAPSVTAEPKTSEPKAPPKSEPSRPPEPAPSPSPGVELPFIRDPTYYSAKQLDVYPEPLAPIRLDYPESAANARIDGRLTVQLLIDEFGIVNDVSVVDAKPEGYFEEATLTVFRGARFSPAQRQGHPVKSRVVLQVKYLYGDSVGALR